MQISGANLLASQQAMPAAKPVEPGFAPLLHKIAGSTPRDQPKAEPAQVAATPSEPKPAAAMRPGMHIDLKV